MKKPLRKMNTEELDEERKECKHLLNEASDKRTVANHQAQRSFPKAELKGLDESVEYLQERLESIDLLLGKNRDAD
jgi:flagellar motility protein MotE (MotC chaperone)